MGYTARTSNGGNHSGYQGWKALLEPHVQLLERLASEQPDVLGQVSVMAERLDSPERDRVKGMLKVLAQPSSSCYRGSGRVRKADKVGRQIFFSALKAASQRSSTNIHDVVSRDFF